MAPMARAIAKLVKKRLAGNDLKGKRQRFEWETAKDPDPTQHVFIKLDRLKTLGHI